MLITATVRCTHLGSGQSLHWTGGGHKSSSVTLGGGSLPNTATVFSSGSGRISVVRPADNYEISTSRES